MKAHLMFRDREFDMPPDWPRRDPALSADLVAQERALRQDLELETLFAAMSGGDPYLFDVARRAVVLGLENDLDTVRHRQSVLADCLENPEAVRALYALAVEAIERKRRQRLGIIGNRPGPVLSGAISLMRIFTDVLRRMRLLAHEQAASFRSDAFRDLFAMMERELDEDYLARVHEQLAQLKFPSGVLISADLGRGNVSRHHVLRRPRTLGWLQRIVHRRPSAYSFRLAPRDDAGGRILTDLRERGIHRVANALAQSADHVLDFFHVLRAQLGFYVACLNLHDRLEAAGAPVCMPRVLPAGRRRLRFEGLHDVCLSLHLGHGAVGNSLDAEGANLVIVTGANRGGKSVFLRSLGLSQLMLQSGMFVGAQAYEGELCADLFTHYRREEDASMTHGKFEEEIARMSGLADHLAADAVVLFNESFAATNEREGSEIAHQIVDALVGRRVKVFFVTHLYSFARGVFDRHRPDAVFLRAERLPDGRRTFRVVEGEPFETSYGEDLYRATFRDDAGTARPTPGG